MATLHLEGNAEAKYFSFTLTRREVRQGEFCDEFIMRYDDEGSERAVNEFKMLVQTISVNAYLQKFEDLKALV